MDKEPLLPTVHRPLSAAGRRPLPALFPLPESEEVSVPLCLPLPPSPRTPSLKHLLIFGADETPPPISPIAGGATADDLQYTLPFRTKSHLHRSKTAPAMSTINDIDDCHDQGPPSSWSTSIVRQAFILLLVYLALGVVVYYLNRGQFAAAETHPVVDALYFCIVTMCTIGYGDITPSTPATKVFSILFVLIGFGFIDILLSGVVSYVLDLQETLLLTAVKGGAESTGGSGSTRSRHSYLVDIKKGRMRIRMKVALALGVVVVCVGVGTAAMHFIERLGWLDSFYLSVMSVTTVGYGDRAFKSMAGRIFASIWLLVSTLAVARAFLYLAEARIDKRHRQMAKWVLGREITVSDLLAADIDNNGFVSKSEFVIYKLKEMGKISEKDVLLICKQFERLDTGNCGKITLSDLMEHHHH